MANTQIYTDYSDISEIGDCQVAGSVCQRLNMEDVLVFGESGERKLYAVLDGHDGIEAAEYFAKTIPQKILECEDLTAENIQKIFVDEDEHYVLHSAKTDAGTTFSGVLMVNEIILTINVGDSRTVLRFADQTITSTNTHKPNKEWWKRIRHIPGSSTKGGYLNGRLGMSRALGDGSFKLKGNKYDPNASLIAKPDVVKYKQKNITDIIIASDGLWDIFDHQQIFKKFVDKNQGSNIAEILVKAAHETRKDFDNTSVIVIKK